MALCRCLNYHPPRGNRYMHYTAPVGYPDTSSICGRVGCNEPGYIWLDIDELNMFINNHERIFKIPNHAVKLKVSDQLFNRQ